MSFFSKDKLGLRLQQFIILVLHIILIRWMYYSLFELGMETTEVILLHYVGMSVYGALLIRGCAAWGKYRYRLEIRNNKDQEKQENLSDQ